MTDVRTFRADSMQQALDLVRNEMGAEAVILHTRQIPQRKIIPWKKAKEVIEVTAGIGVNVRSAKAKATAAPALPPAPSIKATAASKLAEVEQTFGELVRQAKTTGTLDSLEHRLGQKSPRFSNPAGSASAKQSSAPQQPDFRRVVVDHRTVGKDHGQEGDDSQRYVPTAEEFSQKLDAIQKMIESLGQGRNRNGGEDVPRELFHLYTELIEAEVEDDLARDLIFRLKRDAAPEIIADRQASKQMLLGLVEKEIRCATPITPRKGRRKVVALVGPTGVGKTTTIAKLAANFRLRDGVKMGLVTVDTYRIAAVEQLRTYADIIDLPMKVVTTPMEMKRALDELVGLDLVLIDTAGRSPRDELKLQELKTLLTEAQVDEVHLVMSMTASAKSLEATISKFAAANTTSVILTKLDEAAGMGPLLSVPRKFDLPVSYLTTGQDVPDDIEPANASRMARLVLGNDKIPG